MYEFLSIGSLINTNFERETQYPAKRHLDIRPHIILD